MKRQEKGRVMETEVNIFKCLDYLRDNAPAYAQAKANRVYLEEYRKSLKAIEMAKAETRGLLNEIYYTGLNCSRKGVSDGNRS